MREEPELLEAQFTGFEAEGVGDVLAVDGNRNGSGGDIVTVDRDIRTGVMNLEVDGAAGRCWDCVLIEETCGLHSSGLLPDSIFLGVKEEGFSGGSQEDTVGGVTWDEPILVMKLEVPKAELSGAAMRESLGVFAGPETEI